MKIPSEIKPPLHALNARGHSKTTWTKRGVLRVSRKSTGGHDSVHFCPLEGGGGLNWVKFGPRSL